MEILNIAVPVEEALIYQELFPFIWREKEFKYLGVKITTHVDMLYQSNFLPLLNEIKKRFK